MSDSWKHVFIYAFPPFSMIWPTINKVLSQSEKALIKIPMWPTQIWFRRGLESNSTASHYSQSTFTAVKHKETSPSAPEIESTSPTLLRERGTSSRLP